MALQGEADFATLNEQPRPSALRPDLLAAKAALVALMQNTNRAAATISIVNLMGRSFPGLIATSCVLSRHRVFCPFHYITKSARADGGKSARSLHKNHACIAQTGSPAGFDPGIRRVSFRRDPNSPGFEGLPDQSFPANYPALNQPIDELALAEIKSAILTKLRLAIGKDAGMATRHDWYKAAALALRDRIVHRWLTAEKKSYDAGAKRVYYLSLEFLIGRLFTDALNNMGLLPVFEAALGDLGVGLADLRKCEPDAALGNGGLGRPGGWVVGRLAHLALSATGL